MGVKTYKWLKLYNNFFADPKMKKLRRIAGGDTYTCIYLKMMLASINTDGVLEYEGIEPTIEAELSLKLDEEETNVKVVLGFLQTQNIAEIDKNMITFPNLPDLIGEETESAIRMRKMRQKNRQQNLLASQCDEEVTEPLQDSSQPVTTEKEIEIEIELEKDIEPSLYLSPKNEIERVDFKTFKKNILEFCPNFGFSLVGKLGYSFDHQGFCFKNGLIFNLHKSNLLTKEESLDIWNYLYSVRVKVFEQATIQNNQRAHHEK